MQICKKLQNKTNIFPIINFLEKTNTLKMTAYQKVAFKATRPNFSGEGGKYN
jgi:hypothetical protein